MSKRIVIALGGSALITLLEKAKQGIAGETGTLTLEQPK